MSNFLHIEDRSFSDYWIEIANAEYRSYDGVEEPCYIPVRFVERVREEGKTYNTYTQRDIPVSDLPHIINYLQHIQKEIERNADR